ncbi:fungal-specific transcription factor domain-containing protein [Exophiala viscosa]|uniref:Fungal-specific transcription factor domain-containing protein n=2 Tax=Exophiala viscosa TaxID=2486360 RepID=A0AAN6IE71_9EURO|nr:fungal-specific transcription factor domain-containing protein [Exophiala viscosa]
MPWSSSGDFDTRPTTSSPVIRREAFGQGRNSSNNGEALSLQDVSRGSSSAGPSAQNLHARPHEQTVNVEDDDGLVDVLATTTFNDSSDADMGYFGLSSNHALFGSLSDVFIKASRLFGAEGTNIQGPPLTLPEQQRGDDAPPTHADMAKASGQEHNPQNNNRSYNLPRYQDAVLLINHYFTTVGFVLPYVDRATLVSQYLKITSQNPPNFRRGFFALISIICALSLSSLGDDHAEIYYQRAMAVLSPRCLRGSSLETVQALLLIVAYQQNSQRSVSSWTTHALAVKAALQHGLHSPSVRQRQSKTNADLMQRLWTGIVFDDGIIGAGLGRPGLVHPHLLQSYQNDGLQQPLQFSAGLISVESMGGQAYLSTLGSSSGILASIVGFMYNHNVETSEQRSLSDLIRGYNELFRRLQDWRETVSHFGGLVSITELGGLNGCYEALRLRILLSIHYHRLLLMTSWPIIIAFANVLVEGVAESHSGQSLSWDEYTPVANTNWFAVRELCAITNAITTSAEPFLHSNAAWYTCNYT